MQNLVFYSDLKGLLRMRKRMTNQNQACTILTRLQGLRGLLATLTFLFLHIKLNTVIQIYNTIIILLFIRLTSI